MKTPQTHFENEQARIKDLFQQLFQLQIQMEECSDCRFQTENEVAELRNNIDQLMQTLMDRYLI